MREQRKKIIAGLAAALVLLALTGCTRATPKNLLNSMTEKTADVTSVEMNMTLDVVANGDVQGTTADMTIKMDANVQSTFDPEIAYIEGSMDMAFMGQKQSVEMEIYTEEEDSNYMTYSRSGSDDWYKTKTEHISLENDWTVFKDMHQSFELNKDLEEVDGKECYVLSGDLSGEELSIIMESATGLMGDSGDILGDIDWDEASVPVELYIYRKTQYPAKLTLDAQNLAQAAFDKQELGMDCDTYILEMNYTSFDSVDAMEVPADVKENAITSSRILDYDMEDDYVLEAAEQASELGTYWDSMTISMGGKVITLPCTYEQLKDTGLKFADEDITEDYAINAEDSENLDFVKPGSSYGDVTAALYNALDEPIKLSDALVCEIAYMELDESDMEIIFPANVKIGMTRDEAVAVYGEPDYTAEDSCGWYQDFEEYEIGVYISYDEETMQIDFMDMYYLTW